MAKRVNTRFVALFAGIIFLAIVVVVAGPMVKHAISRPSVDKEVRQHREKAHDLVKKGDIQAARSEMELAHGLDRTNKEVCVELGDIRVLLTQDEGQAAMVKARKAWMDALGIDPRYQPAIQRLLDSYIDQMEITPSASISQQLQDAANREVMLNPGDTRARGFLHIAILQQYVSGMKKSEQECTESISVLEGLLKNDLSLSEVLYYLIRAKAYLAAEDVRAHKTDEADRLLNECRATLKAATEKFPKNASVNYRAFQGFVMVSEACRDPQQQERDRGSADAVLDQARGNLDEKDPRYADFQYVAAKWARRNGHPEEAERILRAYSETHPNDLRGRVTLARELASSGMPSKRDEAITLLDKPAPTVNRQDSPAKDAELRDLKLQALVDLTSLRVGKYPSLDPANRPAMLEAIDDGYAKIAKDADPDAIPLLRLKGLIAQLKGQSVEAVESLSHALTMMEHADRDDPVEYDLMYQLAKADRQAGQNRAAQKLLARIVEHYESYSPARHELAELYLEENNVKDAALQVGILAALEPKNPSVIRLEISLMQKAGKAADAKQYYDQLSEQTLVDRLTKAQTADSLNDRAETARLLKEIQKEKPDDFGVTVALVQTYYKSDQQQKGREVLAEAMKRTPNEPKLLALQQQLDDPTRADLAPAMEELAADPFYKQIVLGRRALKDGNYAYAVECARLADQMKLNDPSTWDLYFQIYRAEKNWEMAGKAVANLSRMDADHAGGRTYDWLLAIDHGDYEQSIRIARELTAVNSNFGQFWILLGDSYRLNRQFQEAISEYQAALERSTNIESYKGMVECYMNLSQPEAAYQSLLEGCRLFPDSAALRNSRLAYEQNKDPEGVIPARQAVLAAEPQDPQSHLAMASAYVAAAKRTFPSDPKKAEGYLASARDTLTAAVAKFPDHLELNVSLAETLEGSGAAASFEQGVKVLTDLGARPKWKDKSEPLLALAEYLVHGRKYEEAETALQEAWDKTDRNSIEIELRYSSLLVQEHKFPQALEMLKTHADDLRIVHQTIQCYIAGGQSDLATALAKDTLKRYPENPDVLNDLTVVYLDAFNYPDARATAVKVLKIDRDNEAGKYWQALTELRDPISGDLQLAHDNLAKIVAQNPKNVTYKLDYADMLLRIKDIDGAVVQLQDAVATDPLNRVARAKLLEVLVEGKKWIEFERSVTFAELNPAISEALWFREHAYAYMYQKRYAEALVKIREAIEMQKNNNVYERDYLIIVLQSGDVETVIRETDRLIDAGNHDWWIYHLRGAARVSAGKITEAMEQFDKALAAAEEVNSGDAWQQVITSIIDLSPDEALKRLQPRMGDDHWRLQAVQARVRKRDWAGALNDLNPLLDKLTTLYRSDRLAVLRYAAQCSQASGRNDDAKKYYEKWLAEIPNDTAALNNLAFLLADSMNDPSAGLPYCKKAYEIEQKFNMLEPSIQDTYGWVLTLVGADKADLGIKVLRTTLDANPEFIDAQYHLAMALMRKNQPEEAMDHLKKALDQYNVADQKKMQVNPQLKPLIQAAIDKLRQGGTTTTGT